MQMAVGHALNQQTSWDCGHGIVDTVCILLTHTGTRTNTL